MVSSLVYSAARSVPLASLYRATERYNLPRAAKSVFYSRLMEFRRKAQQRKVFRAMRIAIAAARARRAAAAARAREMRRQLEMRANAAAAARNRRYNFYKR